MFDVELSKWAECLLHSDRSECSTKLTDIELSDWSECSIGHSDQCDYSIARSGRSQYDKQREVICLINMHA